MSRQIVFPRTAPDNSVITFSANDDGAVAVIRAISGGLTLLASPSLIAVDSVNEEIFIVNGSFEPYTFLVFGLYDDLNIAPKRSFTTPDEFPNRFATGIAIDAQNNEIYIYQSNFPLFCEYVVFPSNQSGSVTEIRRVTLSTACLGNVALDLENDEVYAPQSDGSKISVFDRLDSDPATPKREIVGALTQLGIVGDIIDGPMSISVDNTNNEIFVGMSGATDKILVFSRLDTGNIAPLRVLNPSTASLVNLAIVEDSLNSEVFFSRLSLFLIETYNSLASGVTAPIRTITGLTPSAFFLFDINFIGSQNAALTVLGTRTAMANNFDINAGEKFAIGEFGDDDANLQLPENFPALNKKVLIHMNQTTLPATTTPLVRKFDESTNRIIIENPDSVTSGMIKIFVQMPLSSME